MSEVQVSVRESQESGKEKQMLTALPVRNDAIVIDRESAIKAMLIISPALAVAATGIVGGTILHTLGLPIHAYEMVASFIVNGVGGLLAVAMLIVVMNKGTAVIARVALLGTTLRMGGVLMGTLMALGPGWGMQKMPLMYWILVGYMVLLASESAVGVYLVRRSKH